MWVFPEEAVDEVVDFGCDSLPLVWLQHKHLGDLSADFIDG